MNSLDEKGVTSKCGCLMNMANNRKKINNH